MELFDGEKPKLCGTRTPMKAPVILSRVEVMTTLFSFLFNDGSRSSSKVKYAKLIVNLRIVLSTQACLSTQGQSDKNNFIIRLT